MSTPRTYDAQLPLHLRRIKRACGKLVKAVGGSTDAGEIIHLDQRRVSERTLINSPDFFHLDQVVALEDEAKGSTEWPQVTRALATHHGFALLPLAAAMTQHDNLHRSLGDVSKETGEVVNKVLNALADGSLTPDEIREMQIPDEIREAIDALCRLLGLVECIANQGGGKPISAPVLRACS